MSEAAAPPALRLGGTAPEAEYRPESLAELSKLEARRDGLTLVPVGS
jgi:hypothetical protein